MFEITVFLSVLIKSVSAGNRNTNEIISNSLLCQIFFFFITCTDGFKLFRFMNDLATTNDGRELF